jgi:hypothetical protein
MSRDIYDKPPSEFSLFEQIRCPTIPSSCLKCGHILTTLDAPWWQVCYHCRVLYIVSPRSCWHFREWNQLGCCKICHGQNETFQHVSRVYPLNDGRLVDVCCSVANWLKGRGFIHPDDPGVGDDELFLRYHPKRS